MRLTALPRSSVSSHFVEATWGSGGFMNNSATLSRTVSVRESAMDGHARVDFRASGLTAQMPDFSRNALLGA